MGRIRKILILLCISVWLLPSLSTGDSVDYFYDDIGRLVKVTKSSNTRILYQYDEVGNLISIIKETNTPQALPPVLQSINPNLFLIGNNYSVIITGQNLLTTSSVTSDNPYITIRNIAAIDTKIIATFSIASGASIGQANITVTTSYGTGSMAINLYEANIIPEGISLFPASTATLSVSLTPSAPEDLKVAIINKNQYIIDTQSSVIIPAGGIANFTVKALQEGTGTVQVGSAEATVFVFGVGGLIGAQPVSVSIGFVPSNTLIHSSPVSVEWPTVSTGTAVSRQVSAEWPTVSAGTAVSRQVSAEWPTVSGAITVSSQVCVKIENN